MYNVCNILRSEKYIIAVSEENVIYKLFQVIFEKDGSMYVNFPYYKYEKGILSVPTIEGGKKPENIELVPGGKITINRAKYSHHPDGTVLFSQTGFIKSIVRKQSIPLENSSGHVFTVQLQGLKDFKIENKKSVTNRRELIIYSFDNLKSQAIKFVGFWYNQKNDAHRFTSSNKEPKVNCITPDGRKIDGYLLSAPPGSPLEEYFLVLTAEVVPLLDKENYSALTFIGGFDHIDVVNDLNKDTKFLALSYPIENADELAKRIGQVDIDKELRKTI